MKKSTIVKIPKASELVAATLRRQIVTGELKPGELLPNEAILMQQFGVSRPTLREAFRILESEAIITVLRGHAVADACWSLTGRSPHVTWESSCSTRAPR